MKSPSIKDHIGISSLWGLFDVCAIALYVTLAIKRERVPFFSDLFDAAALMGAYESAVPVAIALAGCALLASLPISAYLMLRNKRSGLYLASAQLPFRIALIVPSAFFLNHLPLFNQSTAAFLAAFLCSESIKLWSLYTYAGRRTPHAACHGSPAQRAGKCPSRTLNLLPLIGAGRWPARSPPRTLKLPCRPAADTYPAADSACAVVGCQARIRPGRAEQEDMNEIHL